MAFVSGFCCASSFWPIQRSPLTSFISCVFALLVHSQTLPHISIAKDAESVFEYAFTLVNPLFALALKFASFGMCLAACFHFFL